MGTFSVPIEIADEGRSRWIAFDALVDTGASICSFPASALQDLGIRPLFRQSFKFGEGTLREMDVGQTWIRVEGREVVTLVLFNDEGTTPLLGAIALESLFMGVDPLEQRLVPVEGLIMEARAEGSP